MELYRVHILWFCFARVCGWTVTKSNKLACSNKIAYVVFVGLNLLCRGYIIILSTQNAKHYSHSVTPTHFLFDIKIISWNTANVFRLVHVLINSNDVNSIIYSAPVPWNWQYISVTNTQNLASSMELVSFISISARDCSLAEIDMNETNSMELSRFWVLVTGCFWDQQWCDCYGRGLNT